MEIIAPSEKYRLFLFHLAKSFLYEDDVAEIKSEFSENGLSVFISLGNKTYSATENFNQPLHFEKERAKNVALGKAFVKAVSNCEKRTVPYGTLIGVKPVKVPLFYLEKGLCEKDVTKILKDEYFVSEGKAKLLYEVAKTENKLSFGKKDIMLYFSVPFCPTRCNYCSFVSVKTEKEAGLIDEYLSVMFSEIEGLSEIIKEKGLNIKGIYIGGGTPGILSEKQLFSLFSKIFSSFAITPDTEFTFEIGRPDTVTSEKLLILKDFGIKRICINTQTTSDDVLLRIGRHHTRADYFSAMEKAKNIGTFSVNTDLILGLDGDTAKGFEKSLSDVFSLSPDSITIHALCLKNAASIKEVLEDDTLSDTMTKSHKKLLESGYFPYYLYRQKNAVSNLENTGFAKKGLECIYNIAMMEDMISVLAVGAGAATKILPEKKNGKIERFYSYKYPFDYIKNKEKINLNLAKIKALL